VWRYVKHLFKFLCVCFSWVFETTEPCQRIHKIFTVCLNRDISLSDNSHPLITQVVSHDDRQRSTLRYFSLPWVGVHAFKFSVLQLMLPFSLAWNYRRCRIYFRSARRCATHLTRNQIHRVDCVSSGVFTSELMLLFLLKCHTMKTCNRV
jgi:hypothetical protein